MGHLIPAESGDETNKTVGSEIVGVGRIHLDSLPKAMGHNRIMLARGQLFAHRLVL